jgi:1-aminocyclopropane-1-carboxylate deaminase/D-cysteine desulfhydrase-like pyridoxal-dependent ACC family enzyme
VNAQPETLHRPIERRDIEAKIRELQGDVEETARSATSTLVTVGAVVAVGVIAVAFILGKRRGRRRTTVVEVRRI